jgi:hypothetical protein
MTMYYVVYYKYFKITEKSSKYWPKKKNSPKYPCEIYFLIYGIFGDLQIFPFLLIKICRTDNQL